MKAEACLIDRVLRDFLRVGKVCVWIRTINEAQDTREKTMFEATPEVSDEDHQTEAEA